MFKLIVSIFISGFSGVVINAQAIQCSFSSLRGTKVKFGTFEGMQSKTLDSAFVNEKGEFAFQFPTQKPAVGYLITAENKPYFLILDKGEQIELSGEDHVGGGTKWRIVIHLTFVASGVLFALMDWIADKREFHGTHK